MLKLLQDIAVDANESMGTDNPLRQVIINTHSPAIVQQVPEQSLLVAESSKASYAGRSFNCVAFACLPNTWRTKQPMRPVALGTLLGYLNPVLPAEPLALDNQAGKPFLRVIDRADVKKFSQPLLPYPELSER